MAPLEVVKISITRHPVPQGPVAISTALQASGTKVAVVVVLVVVVVVVAVAVALVVAVAVAVAVVVVVCCRGRRR